MSFLRTLLMWLLLSQHLFVWAIHILFLKSVWDLSCGSGLFPFDYETYLHKSDCCHQFSGILSLIRFSNYLGPLAYSVLYPRTNTTLSLKLFRENQLFPSSGGISPLATFSSAAFFNGGLFRSSMELPPLHLNMARSPVSGLPIW